MQRDHLFRWSRSLSKDEREDMMKTALAQARAAGLADDLTELPEIRAFGVTDAR